MQAESQAAWICTALMRLGTRMATGFDQHFASHGLSQAQFRILLAVWSLGGRAGVAPSALAENLLIERGTVSVLTSRMVTKGWLERLPGENRRSFRLHLTPAGRKLLDSAVPRALQLADMTLAGFSRSQLDNLQANLEHLETRLREFDPSSPKKELP
jgi:DNA-binding MarR family transcriptional regulator